MTDLERSRGKGRRARATGQEEGLGWSLPLAALASLAFAYGGLLAYFMMRG